jgi:hypothetical protein
VTADRAEFRRRSWQAVGAAFLVTLAFAVPPAAPAATFPDLYTVSVARDLAARDDRSDVFRRGMALLLTRITGRRQVADDPRLADLISNAARYNNSYAELRDEYRVGFIRSEVDSALLRLDVPLWGDERPSTLLWVAADFGDGWRAELEAADAGPVSRPGALTAVPSNPLPGELEPDFDAIAETLLGAADERGLPIVLPRLDEEDRRYVRFADVWGGFDAFIERAAGRYGVDAVLIGRVAMTDTGPEVRWILRRGESRQTRTTSTLRAGIDWLADQYAAEYTIVGGVRATWIRIEGITSWPDFGRVVEYLQSLSVVDSVDVESLSADGELLLRVAARGDDSQLAQYLTLDGSLVPAAEPPVGSPGAPGAASEMVFVPGWLAPASSRGSP